MTTAGEKIIKRISAFPEEEREALEHNVLDYIDWLAEMKADLAKSEADVAAGRVKPVAEVFDRLRAKYAS